VRRVRGVDTKVHHEPPPGVVPLATRGFKSGARTCLVVETARPPVKFSIHNNTGVNLLRGLVERVFFVPTANGLQKPPRPVNLSATLRDCYKRLTRCPMVVPHLSRTEFVNTYSGDGRQMRRYQAAADSLERLPLRRADAYLDTFVKCEKINFTKKIDPAPRVIQPRQPRFNVEFGRFIKPLEHAMYGHLARRLYGHPCVAKGFNAVDTARILKEKWAMFDRPVCVGMDASRFDQHVSVDALRWTHKVYQSCFPGCGEFRSLCDMMLHNRGIASAKDATYRYEVDGCRMSGDMDTALGNCVLMCSMVWSYCHSLGIRHQILDNGDDVVVIFETVDLPKFQAGVSGYFTSLGFTMVCEAPVFVLEQVEFCQTRPVFNGREYVMVRDPSSIAKDLVCTVGTDDIRPWLKAIGECGLSLTSGIPIFQAFYSWCVGQGGKKSAANHIGFACGMTRLARGLAAEVREIDERARYSFWLAFGCLPDAQVAIEREWEALSGVVQGNRAEISHDELQDVCGEWYTWPHNEVRFLPE
jgi:hypothetical protein